MWVGHLGSLSTRHAVVRGGQDDNLLSGGPGDDTIFGDPKGADLLGGHGYDELVLGNNHYAGDNAVDTVRFKTP